MPEPGVDSFNFNETLTDISIALIQDMDKFAAPAAIPSIPVNGLQGKVVSYSKDDFRRIEAEKVAPGGDPPEAGYDIDTDLTWDATSPAKLAKPITRQELRNSKSPVRAIQDAIQFVLNNVMLKRDKDFVNAYFGNSIWDTNLDGSTSDFTQWENSSGSPIRTIANEIDTAEEENGFRPNVFIPGPKVWTELKNHDNVTDRIKHTQTGVVTEELFAQMIGVDRVIVPGVSEDTSSEGESASQSYMFGKDALLLYAPQNPGLQTPSAGYIFTPEDFAGNDLGVGIRRYEDEKRDVQYVEAQLAYDMKVVESGLGVFLENAIA